MDYSAFKLVPHESQCDRSQVDVAARLLLSCLVYITNSITWSSIAVMGFSKFKHPGAFDDNDSNDHRFPFDCFSVLSLSICAVPACHNVCVTPFCRMIRMLMIIVVTGFLSDCASAIGVHDPAGVADKAASYSELSL